MSIKLYESAAFTVLDYGYGVEIWASLAVPQMRHLQGDEATRVAKEIEGAARRGGVPAEVTERTDARLSEYFTDEPESVNHGDTARRLIGERE